MMNGKSSKWRFSFNMNKLIQARYGLLQKEIEHDKEQMQRYLSLFTDIRVDIEEKEKLLKKIGELLND